MGIFSNNTFKAQYTLESTGNRVHVNYLDCNDMGNPTLWLEIKLKKRRSIIREIIYSCVFSIKTKMYDRILLQSREALNLITTAFDTGVINGVHRHEPNSNGMQPPCKVGDNMNIYIIFRSETSKQVIKPSLLHSAQTPLPDLVKSSLRILRLVSAMFQAGISLFCDRWLNSGNKE